MFFKRKERFVSLNVKVLVLSLVIAIIPSAVIGSMLYSKSVQIVKQKQESSSKNSLQNISANINVVMEYAHNVSLFLIQNEDVRNALMDQSLIGAKRLKKENAVMKCLAFYTGQKNYIDSISIVGDNGLKLSAGVYKQDVIDENFNRRLEEAKGGAIWVSDGVDTTSEMIHLTLGRTIKDINNLKQNLGTLYINVSNQVLHQQLSNYIKAYSGYIMLADRDSNIIAESGDAQLGQYKTLEKFKNAADSDGFIEEIDNKNDKITYYMGIPDTEWVLVSTVRISSLLAENHTIRGLLVMGIAVSMMLCIFVSIFFSKSILLPLRLLTEKIKEIKEDNYKVSLDFDSNDEIGLLSCRFNDMTHRLDELVNEVLMGKVLQGESELKALQAQIDPHFLYNNLDTAYWMSRLEHAEKTGKVLLALTDLYRLSVSSGNKLISVEKEVLYIRNYIVIQQMRLDDLISFQVEVEENVLELATMRFVLQPLVENSIQHGILPTGKQGGIVIRVFIKEENLFFEVEDNGGGIEPEILQELLDNVKSEDKRGMAIRNIDQRIKLKFGQNYGLTFEKTDQGGILAVVIQPLGRYTLECG